MGPSSERAREMHRCWCRTWMTPFAGWCESEDVEESEHVSFASQMRESRGFLLELDVSLLFR